MKEVTFQLDLKGGAEILEQLAAPAVKASAEAIAARARGMAVAVSSDPPDFTVSTQVGTIRRGTRAIATVRSKGRDAHQNYVGHQALAKSKDAGKVR